jgi:hypothetical protein
LAADDRVGALHSLRDEYQDAALLKIDFNFATWPVCVLLRFLCTLTNVNGGEEKCNADQISLAFLQCAAVKL